MQKCIVKIIIIFSLLLVSCSGNNEEGTGPGASLPAGHNVPGLYREITVEYMNDIFDFTINENGDLLLLDKEIIYILDMDGVLKKKITVDAEFCTEIAADNKNIWVWDSTDSALLHLDIEGNLIKKEPLPLNSVIKIIKVEEDLFILGTDKSSFKNIYKYNSINNNIEKLPINDVSDMCAYKNEYLLVVIETGVPDKNIIIFNYNTGEIENKTTSSLKLIFNDIYYSKTDEFIYYVETDRIMAVSIDGSIEKTFPDVTGTKPMLEKIIVWKNNILLLDKKNGKIYVSDTPNKLSHDDKTLRILSYVNALNRNYTINSIMENTKNKYGNIKFEFEYIESNIYYDKLKAMFMSEEKSFDVFYLQSQYSPYFVKNNVMHDLTEYKFVTDRFKDCFERIRELCTYEDYLFALPSRLSVNALVFNNELAEKIGIEKPALGWTWNDYYDMAEKIRNSNALNNIYIMECRKGFFKIFFESFNCENIDLLRNKVTLMNEDFKTILQIYKKLYDENLILDDNIPVKHRDNTMLFLSGFYDNNQSSSLIPVPTFSRYNIDMEYLCVNKLSNKKEISAYFISNLLNKEMYHETVSIPLFFSDIQTYKNFLSK